MLKKQKRDNAYYLGRLEKEHPTIHANFLAGKYDSARAALEAAGLRKPTSALSSLKTAWSKANTTERAAFLRDIGAVPSVSSGSTAAPITVGRCLTPAGKLRITSIMDTRRIKMGDVMDELGMKRLNPSLGMALSRDTEISAAMIRALEAWLPRQP